VGSVIAVLALRRLASRLVNSAQLPDAPSTLLGTGGFLDAHRTVVAEGLRTAVGRACIALEIALRDEVLWSQLAAHLSRELRQILLDQVQALRRSFERAVGAGEEPPQPERLARALRNGRRAGVLGGEAAGDEGECFERLASPDLALDALHSEVEPRVAGSLAQRLQEKGRNSVARLLELRTFLGEVWLVGLVDYFLCRALEADARLGGQFVFVHVDRPEDLWEDDLDALAALIEHQTPRIEALLDQDESAAEGNGKPLDDDAIERLFQEGHACYLSADYQRAITLFTAALRLDPAHAALLAYRGDAYRLLCEYERAIADYSAALELNPNSPAVLVQRATAHRLLGDLQAVIADCTAAIALDAQHATAYTTRGDARLEMAAFAQAIADYSSAIDLNPSSPWPFFGRGKAHLHQVAYSEAIEDFGHVLALNPHHVLAQLYRGDACRHKGLLAQAIMDYSEVLRHHPRNALAYANRGKAYELQGDLDRAIADYTQALKHDRNNANLYCSRGTLYRRKCEFQPAKDDLDEAIRKADDNAEALYNRGLVLLARGLYEEARADFDDAVHVSPGMLPAFLARALVQDRLGRYTDAIQDCGRALKIDATSAPAHVIRGTIASHAGLYAQAITDLTQAYELDAQFLFSLQERGMAHMLAGDLTRAAKDATRLIGLNPNLAMPFAIRGMVRQMQGEHNQAVANFARALELDSHCLLAGLHQNLADAGRRETIRVLANYIEGVRPVLPEFAPVEKTRSKQESAAPLDQPPEGTLPQDDAPGSAVDAAETTDDLARIGRQTVDHIPVPSLPGEADAAGEAAGSDRPPASNRKRRKGTETAAPEPASEAPETSTTPAPPQDVAPDDDSTFFFELDAHAAAAVNNAEADTELMLADEPATAVASAERTEVTPAPEPPAPEIEILVCPACGLHTALAQPLPDGRVQCPNCKAAFVRGESPRSGVATLTGISPFHGAVTASQAASTLGRKKKQKADEDDDEYDDGKRLTRKQKVILGASSAAVLLLLIYFLFPSWAWIQSAFASVPPPPAPVRVSADELMTASLGDAKSSARFEGILLVYGEVGKVLDKGKRLRFKSKLPARAVEATFSAAPDNLKENTTVTVRGEVDGWNKGVLLLVDCKLVPTEDTKVGEPAVSAKK
jgi:tetratricopeptide (TPR) repeat protein